MQEPNDTQFAKEPDEIHLGNLPEGSELVVPHGTYLISKEYTMQQWEPFEIRILATEEDLKFQQRWVDHISGTEEWRDVPVVTQDA